MACVAFIGVGNMGGPMARNLVKAGHDVRIFDLSEALMEAVVSVAAASGVTGADTSARPDVAAGSAIALGSAREAVQGAAVVISMLPSGEIVEKLYIDRDDLIGHVAAGTLLIDCSTISPASARRVAHAATSRGLAMIDAPVSGGVGGAQAGTLTFIAGGEASVVELATPILRCMGKNVFHAGGNGAGQVAKICNNMLLAIQMAGTAEALRLGVDNGLDPAVLSEIMLKSSGRNWSLEVYNPWPGVMENVPAARDYSGGFQVNLMNKDLGLAMEAALTSRSATPMGSLARNLYAMHAAQGAGGLDFSSILQLFSADSRSST
jgi:3-hydroxyisobutyrate dehydrogenase